MALPSQHRQFRQQRTLWLMACTAATLLVLIGLVKLWPAPGEEPLQPVYATRGQETIQMEEIVPTQQAKKTPPPPAPLPPVIVPNDVVLEEVELDLSDAFLPLEAPGTDDDVQEGTAAEGTPARFARADTGPKPVRVVEPEYTREARKQKIRAEVVVEVLVDERGRVTASKVVERFLLGGDEDAKTPVAQIGYGLEEAALSAADRWLFRPARQNGVAVRSYHSLTFSFGV